MNPISEYLIAVENTVKGNKNNNIADPVNIKTIEDQLVLAELCNRICASKGIPAQFDNCAGNFNNDGSMIAVIAEQPAKLSPLSRTYPFLDIVGCSGWLNRQLVTADVDTDKVFWVNAANYDGSDNDPEILRQINPKRIICLGKVALKWAKKNGWNDVSYFHHPQYWKRFRSKEPYPFIELLSGICSKL